MRFHCTQSQAHSTVARTPDSAVVSYWGKYVHKVLINGLGGLSLHRKSVVRLTDRLDMSLGVYPGRKTTTQQQEQPMHTAFHYHPPSIR